MRQKADRSALYKRVGIAALLVIIAAGAAVGTRLLHGISHGSPVAATFTRVGGPTRVETAIDASRFWSTPPACFVTIPANARQEIMLNAAQFAMAHDAPLLYHPRNWERRQRVHTVIHNWRVEARTRGFPRPARVTARSLGKATGCVTKKHPAKVGQLSTLAASNQLLPEPLPLRVQNTLARAVVFAVARGPRYPPDVAVGLALAAHMAIKYPAVSLVVLPHYLEADRELENQLRNHGQLVEGGVVLGSARILTEDTHTLLRQILTSADQRAVLSQEQTILSSVGSGLASVLPMIGGAAAAGALLLVVVPVVIPPIIEATRRTEHPRPSNFRHENGGPDVRVPGSKRPDIEPASSAGTDWLNVLHTLSSQLQDQYVTIWLRSGWQVAGVVKDIDQRNGQQQSEEHARPAKVFQLDNARVFEPREGEYMPVLSKNPQRTVFVSVEDVHFIGVGFQERTVILEDSESSAPGLEP